MQNTFIKIFFLLITIFFGSSFMTKPKIVNTLFYEFSDAKFVVENYLSSIETYCEKYKDEHRIYIENELLIHPSTYFANDIEGLYNSDCEASLYFLHLKENKVKVSYNRDFKIETCTIGSDKIMGTRIKKTVRSSDGSTSVFNEFIELQLIQDRVKIISTFSDLFQNYNNVKCTNLVSTPKPIVKKDCQIFDSAEAEYKKGNSTKALEYYKMALNCSENMAYVESKIRELNTASGIKKSIQEGNSFYQKKQYSRALASFKLAKEGASFLNSNEINELDRLIKQCNIEIAFSSNKQQGDYYFDKGFYDKAEPYYIEALKFKPSNAEIIRRKKVCDTKIGTNYIQSAKDEISEGQRLIEVYQKNNKGAIILMKYRQSGLLNGKQLFYIAQILNNSRNQKKIRKQLDLSKRECCVIVRQLITEIENIKDNTFNIEDLFFFKKTTKCK